MSSREGFKTYTHGQILLKEIELKEAQEKLVRLDADFEYNPHKAGSHERIMQFRRWSDALLVVNKLREELEDMRKAERS